MLSKSIAVFGSPTSPDSGVSELPRNRNKSGYGKFNSTCRCFQGHCVAGHSTLQVPELTSDTCDGRQEVLSFPPYNGKSTRVSVSCSSYSPISVGRESMIFEYGIPCDIHGCQQNEPLKLPEHRYEHLGHTFQFLDSSAELVYDLIQLGGNRYLSGADTLALSEPTRHDRTTHVNQMEKLTGQLNCEIEDFDLPFEAGRQGAQADASTKNGLDEAQDLCDVICYRTEISTFANRIQKCIRSKDMRGGRELHLLLMINGLEDHPFLASHVIHMFSSFELLSEAQRIFSKLNDPNVYSWSAIISAYAMCGKNDEALDLYLRMNDSLIEPDGHTFVVALKVCTLLGRLEQGRTIHSCIIGSGLESDIYVGSAVINMYSNCGKLADACVVFERLPERNIVTWSTLIKGYWQENFSEEALRIFTQMKQEAMEPDHITYVIVLKACSCVSLEHHIRKIHAEIIERGYESNEWVCNALVDSYSRYDTDASSIMFNRLQEQNNVACSLLIAGYTQHNCGLKALQVYEEMQHVGMQPDVVIFICVLKACTSIAALKYGQHIHAHIIDNGFEAGPLIGVALIDLYAKCGSLEDAELMLLRIPGQNIAAWNALITGYSQHDHDLQGLLLFDQLRKEGFDPDSITCVSVLTTCKSLERSREIHNLIIYKGLESDVRVSNALVDSYAKAGSFEDAHMIFEQHPGHDIVTWSSLIGGYVQHNRHEEALELFNNMQENGIEPDPVAYACILKACSKLADGRCLHRNIISSGFERETFLGSILVEMYSRCGSIEDAHRLFYKLEKPSVVTWNAIIAAYIQHDNSQEALRIFKKMEAAGVDVNVITFIYVLKACSTIAAVESGRQIHCEIVSKGLEADVVVSSTLINMYAKNGNVNDACILFDRLQNRNIVTWSALLAGYAHDGDYCSAVRCFERMQEAGICPDDVAFLSLFSTCSRSEDLVDKGCLHFRSMRDDYGILPKVEHYNSMLDLFGNAGFLSEAEDLLETVPCSCNVIGWTSLLHSCKVHRSIDIGKRCFDYIVNLDVANAAGYVLMSGIYATFGMWEDAKRVQELRKHVNGWKKPAKAYIEINHEVHSFIVGDRVHPRNSDIYAKLNSLSEQMRHEGYEPDTDLSFEPGSNEYKTTVQCEHAERLAIAFGLLSTAQGSTVRVSKNLRMCADCHSATKLISKIEMRQIIVTDTHCIHRFLDGHCSCTCNY